MPRITDEQITEYKQRGFVLVEGFLTDDEVKAAMSGVREIWPTYEEYVAGGRNGPERPQHLFPFRSWGLNSVCVHPELIDAAERITGFRDLVLGEAYLGNKYADGKEYEPAYHMDWSGNTLGPVQEPDDFLHPTFFIYLVDVVEGQAPIHMVPTGRPHDEAVAITAPAGSLAIYSIYTIHAASSFLHPGDRPALWIDLTPKHRIWDFARLFTVKTARETNPHTMECFADFFARATPRQIELLGFPRVGDPLWTDRFLDGMVARYPGFDPDPYRVARA